MEKQKLIFDSPEEVEESKNEAILIFLIKKTNIIHEKIRIYSNVRRKNYRGII